LAVIVLAVLLLLVMLAALGVVLFLMHTLASVL
jgi:hypothetical protein